MYFNKLTIVIVTFHSEHIIEKCLNNLDENFKKIVVENSSNKDFTENLKNKYINLDTINIGYDSGFAYAANRGIEKCSTEYILLINPDSFPDKDCIKKIINTAESDNEIAVVAPITLRKNRTQEFRDYGYFDNKKIFKKNANNLLQVDWVNGNVFLLKRNILNLIGMFDENFFLECDELDLQKRIFNLNKKVIIDFNAKSFHLEGKSADAKYAIQMKFESVWHNSWSNFYYLKKHYGFPNAILNRTPKALIDLLKSLIFFILRNKIKSKIYMLYFCGFVYSFLGKKPTYRAKIY